MESVNAAKRRLAPEHLEALRHYRPIDEMHEVRLGAHVRYLTHKLMPGGFVLRVDPTPHGPLLLLKSSRLFSVRMDDVVLFQKLSPDEALLLHARDCV